MTEAPAAAVEHQNHLVGSVDSVGCGQFPVQDVFWFGNLDLQVVVARSQGADLFAPPLHCLVTDLGSVGRADAAVVLAPSTALADAVATEVGNRVTSEQDIRPGIDFARGIEGVDGVVIIVGDRLGAAGSAKLMKLEGR